ncbi:MAG: hypothetical protein IJ153_00665 [Clostridia bacterium]|nr:hypothetical protein [Clostridia bacterium]
MYITNTFYPPVHRVQGYPPVVQTQVCRLCGEKVRITPMEALTNHDVLASDGYVCPLCRHLVSEAESSIPVGWELNRLSTRGTAFPFQTCTMNEMEDWQYDRYEEESDSDEAADDECEGFGSMCPPSDEGPDAEECGDGDLPLEADLWLQVHVHLTIRR